MRPPNDLPRDDVDRVFARLRPAAPPPDLAAQILAALPPEGEARRLVPSVAANRQRWQWVTAVAAVLLLLFCVRLGAQMADSGALGVLGEIFSDLGAFFDAPGEYLAALAVGIPWGDLVLALAALGLFWYGGGVAVNRQSAGHRE